MKKIILFSLTSLLFLVLTACGTKQSQTTSDKKSNDPVSILDKTKLSVADSIKRYQETYPNSDITSLELEETLGQPVYKIEGLDDQKEYELVLNAKTKEISKQNEKQLETDEQGGQERNEEKLNLDQLITLQKAAKIAQQKADGTPVEFELNQELNVTYWEVKLKAGTKEHSVKLNAQSGEVLSQETDD